MELKVEITLLLFLILYILFLLNPLHGVERLVLVRFSRSTLSNTNPLHGVER